jgi:dimethylglycine dehydrogenase
LLERRELTSGSTWHAAGLMSVYATGYTASRLYLRSHEVYAKVEAETGQQVGFHRCGTLRLASSKDRLDEYRHYTDIAGVLGVRAEIVGPAEVKRLWPLVEYADDLEGALYHPLDGHAAPADVTQALAKGARARGAEIRRQTEAVAIEATPEGEWRIRTGAGDVVCEHVVIATGSFARQTGAMVGLDLPVIPIVHQYLVTEPVLRITERHASGLPELPILRDDTIQGYIREERHGLMFGPYDRDPPVWGLDGIPEDYAGELLAPDLEAMAPSFEIASRRVPELGSVGVRTCVSGPIAVSPDNRPLVGPAWGLRNVWLAVGFTGGIAMGGGIGASLVAWIIDGEPDIDLHEYDPRRFGDYANRRYTVLKAKEAFANNFGINYPDWAWPAARPSKTAPCYERMRERGAVFGVAYGWETPDWFAPHGVEAKDSFSYRRSNAFEHVGTECRAVRERVGLYDLTPASKFEVSGACSAAWLDTILASRLPQVGRSALCYLLTRSGGVACEFTVSRLAEDRFYLVGATVAERHHFDVLARLLPHDGGVSLRNATSQFGAFAIAGPRSREVLGALVDTHLGNAAFPCWSNRELTVALTPSVRALRINYVGELGWELHHRIEYQRQLFDALLAAGEGCGLALVGRRAVESLRLEKSYRALWRDLSTEYTALESRLDRFLDLKKLGFIGQDALLAQRRRGLKRRFTVLALASGDADPFQNETVYREGKPIGRITSAAYGRTVGGCLAHAYVDAPHDAEGTELEIDVLGERRAARVVAPSPYDPAGARSHL